MKTTRVTIGKTVNLGNYQSLKLEVTVEQETGTETVRELTQKALDDLKSEIVFARQQAGA